VSTTDTGDRDFFGVQEGAEQQKHLTERENKLINFSNPFHLAIM
jgi:hypothetical protein